MHPPRKRRTSPHTRGPYAQVTTLSMAKDLHDWSTTTPILCSDCAVFYME